VVWLVPYSGSRSLKKSVLRLSKALVSGLVVTMISLMTIVEPIYFATTNGGKLKEARAILGVEVVGTPLQIDEIQSLDPVEVATKKARSYWSSLKKPLFVEDVALFIDAINGLPGTYIDAFMKALGNEGILEMLKGYKLRTATAQTTIVYVDGKGTEHFFVGKTAGSIALKPRGGGFGWDPIFIPRGSKKTFGEMDLDEKNKFSMRARALLKFKKSLGF